jgi:hypothetical protein
MGTAFLPVAALALAVLAVGNADADRLRQRDQLGAPGWVMPGAALDFDFATGLGYQRGSGVQPVASLLSVSRASAETSLLPTSAAGASYQSFASGAPAIVPGVGLLIYETRTNYLLNSTAPATQTTASLSAGTYTLWVNGSGSATSAAGTATGSGFGAAAGGSLNIFTLSGAGTVTVTVSGSLNAFQLENGQGGTPLIVTGGGTATRAGDFITVTRPPNFGQNVSALAIATPLMPANYGTTQTPLQLDEGDNNSRIDFDRASGTAIIGGGITVSGTAYGAPTTNIWATGASVVIAYALAVNDQAMVSNGTLATYTGGNAMFTVERVVLGANGNGVHQLDGTLQRIAIWPTTRQPNGFLEAIAP